MADLRDSLWLWGLDTNMHNQYFGFESRMTPAEGAMYMGIRNIYMVVNLNKPEPPFDRYSRSFTSFKEVKWSIIGDAGTDRTDIPYGDLDEVLRQAEMFDNVSGGVLDDFFPNRAKIYTPDKIKYIQDAMHNFRKRPLDLWCVYYAGGDNNREHLENVDGAHMWIWKESDLKFFKEKYAKFKADTEDKRRMLGLYCLDYSVLDAAPGTIGRATSIEAMKFQLETYTELLVKGEIEGIIFCSNTAMDLNLPSVEFARKWIDDNHRI